MDSTNILPFFSFAVEQGWHMLEKYLNIQDFLEKSLTTESALKSTGESPKALKVLEFYYFLTSVGQLC